MDNILSTQVNKKLAWLLVSLIILQNLLPVQSHTQMVTTDTGRTVLMCTLDGLQEVSVNEDGLFSEQQVQQHNIFSAAINFSELMSSATTVVKVFQIPSIFIPSLILAIVNTVNITTDTKSFQLIRAPPFS